MGSNENLSRKGHAAGLQQHIHTNPLNPVAPSMNIMSNTVEALIGAVYIDSGRNVDITLSAVQRLGLIDQVPSTGSAPAGAAAA